MGRKWLLLSVGIAALGMLWILANKIDLTPLRAAIGLTPSSVHRLKSKPICSSPVNPNVAAPADCVPAYLANLPPDPGPAGMLTIEGIDSDKDGVRDDVQRFIALKWGHSERAVRSLTTVAKVTQQKVLLSDSVSPEQARKFTENVAHKAIDCYVRSVNRSVQEAGDPFMKVVAAVTNTPARFQRYDKFDALLANMVSAASDTPIEELCGYDPAALPN